MVVSPHMGWRGDGRQGLRQIRHHDLAGGGGSRFGAVASREAPDASGAGWPCLCRGHCAHGVSRADRLAAYAHRARLFIAFRRFSQRHTTRFRHGRVRVGTVVGVVGEPRFGGVVRDDRRRGGERVVCFFFEITRWKTKRSEKEEDEEDEEDEIARVGRHAGPVLVGQPHEWSVVLDDAPESFFRRGRARTRPRADDGSRHQSSLGSVWSSSALQFSWGGPQACYYLRKTRDSCEKTALGSAPHQAPTPRSVRTTPSTRRPAPTAPQRRPQKAARTAIPYLHTRHQPPWAIR